MFGSGPVPAAIRAIIVAEATTGIPAYSHTQQSHQLHDRSTQNKTFMRCSSRNIFASFIDSTPIAFLVT